MKVTVTSEDIVNGARRLSDKCPVARALTRAFGAPVSVGYATYGGVVSGILPDEAMAFIKAFDNLLPVKPFEFIV